MRNYVYLSIRKQKTKQKSTSFLHCFMILILIYYSINKIVSSLVKSDFDNAQYYFKINQINFIGIKSSHRTVTSHMYTITQLHVQLQSEIDPYTNVFLYIYIG